MSAAGPPWRPPPDAPPADRTDVHVWRVPLDLPPAVTARLAPALSPEERAQAPRLSSARERARYVVRRAVLRSILARYVGGPPDALRFRYGRHGKPALDGQEGPDAIRFNASHSAALGVYSVARGRETGIDIERVRGGLAGRSIADRFFSETERAMLHAMPADRYDGAFLRCWTRMEAYVKGTGQGLIGAGRGAPEASGWLVRDLVPAPEYVGALAVEGADWALRSYDWRADD